MHRASSYNMYINQQDAQISVIKLYFILDALHVLDYISPSSGAPLWAVHRIWYMPVCADTSGCCVAIIGFLCILLVYIHILNFSLRLY